MNRWDVALLLIAAYVALTTLVRLMMRRRDQMLGEFRKQMHEEKMRKKKEREERELEEQFGRAR